MAHFLLDRSRSTPVHSFPVAEPVTVEPSPPRRARVLRRVWTRTPTGRLESHWTASSPRRPITAG
jgi:hypothetical protein